MLEYICAIFIDSEAEKYADNATSFGREVADICRQTDCRGTLRRMCTVDNLRDKIYISRWLPSYRSSFRLHDCNHCLYRRLYVEHTTDYDKFFLLRCRILLKIYGYRPKGYPSAAAGMIVRLRLNWRLQQVEVRKTYKVFVRCTAGLESVSLRIVDYLNIHSGLLKIDKIMSANDGCTHAADINQTIRLTESD